MRVLYDLGIKLYLVGIWLASIRNTKAKQWLQGRKNWARKLRQVNFGNQRPIWVHCASLGEFEQGRPVIEALREAHPQVPVVLTFFSPSGFEIRKDYSKVQYVAYLPLDTAANAREFLSMVNPCLAIFVKYEFWHHYFNALHTNQIPLYIVSANFRPDQRFFRWYGQWWVQMLKKTEHLFVQNISSMQLLRAAGIENCSISGDTRFDRVLQIGAQSEKLTIVERFAENSLVVILGSSWLHEEKMMAQVQQQLKSNEKIIIAPHEIHEEHLSELAAQFKDMLRYSQATPESAATAQYLLIDNIGLLSQIYKSATIAFVGGGFGKGVHNVLEPAACGLPILFGPRIEKFQEAKDLVAKKGAFVINSTEQLATTLRRLLDNRDQLTKAGEICKAYVHVNQGATKKICAVLAPKIQAAKDLK